MEIKLLIIQLTLTICSMFQVTVIQKWRKFHKIQGCHNFEKNQTFQ